ncbi:MULTISPECIES: c-type cytochrome [Sphingomonas]|jgi:cytochrome c oxidase cbb3-type subunit III|uniref:Cytochrome c domain-containing protein n=1 Tax=Sphingomonas zeae TaxID=1646122 RepID=A0A7Y6EHS8_9SPHN|nr:MULTISPECIES: hypothetical protein [Sphingomonas]MBB4049750.1 mono/diheme cytochrome c family protein [Sphingomonas zeae]MDK8185782.1 hypothetical protein [Sphingomonas zeae]MDK8215079.1 hypothetical protein [Sphingomonas sp. UMB7805-LC452B]NUU47810.1 hypothetical protein [Sphingomonas zeae]
MARSGLGSPDQAVEGHVAQWRPGRVMVLACLISACGKEARDIGPTVAQTAPVGKKDPRIALFQGNVWQIAQGGRYFQYYGCAGCHHDGAPGTRDLADGLRRGADFPAVFASIAHGHGDRSYATRIPDEQLWQLTAYVRDLERHTPQKRRRQMLDQRSEPQAATWRGPQ